MLKPQMLEILIRSELELSEQLLWEMFSSDAEAPGIVRDVYTSRMKNKTHFFWATITLLMAKSLATSIPKSVVKMAAIVEVLNLARGLQQEALRGRELFAFERETGLSSSFLLTPETIELIGGYLMAYGLERLASFNISCFVQGFALAQRNFLESELLLKSDLSVPNFSDHEYLAIIKLRNEHFAIQIAKSIAKLCGPSMHEEMNEALCAYSKHFSMAIALYQELLLLYAVHHASNNLPNLLKLVSVNYPIVYALQYSSDEEKLLIQESFSSLSQRTGLAKTIYKILQRCQVEEHIVDLIKKELQMAESHINEVHLIENQALLGLLELFSAQFQDPNAALSYAKNLF